MKTPMAYYLVGAALIVCSLLWFLCRTISIKLIVKDIKRRLEEKDNLCCILALLNDLPSHRLWQEDFKFDDYAETLIKDASSLSRCLRDIANLPDERKKEIILELLTESLDRAFSTEDFAKIYADCVLKNVAQKMAGLNGNIFIEEKCFIGLIITKKHLTRDVDQKKDSFKARVLRILENSLIETANQSEKISIRIEMEIFKNSPLPTHEEDGPAA